MSGVQINDCMVQCGWCAKILKINEIQPHTLICFAKYPAYWIETVEGIKKLFPVDDQGRCHHEDPKNYAVYADDKWVDPDPHYKYKQTETDENIANKWKEAYKIISVAEILAEKQTESRKELNDNKNKLVEIEEGKVANKWKDSYERMSVAEILAENNEGNESDVEKYLNNDEESVETNSSEYLKVDLNETRDSDNWSDELNQDDLRSFDFGDKQQEFLDEEAQEQLEKSVDDKRQDPNFSGYEELKLGSVHTSLWPKSACIDLLFAFGALKDQKKQFEKIEEKLTKAGYMYTSKQIKRKYNELLSDFKKIKRYNATSGNDPLLNWPFFDALDEICGRNANVEPVLACSSINPTLEKKSQRKILVEANDCQNVTNAEQMADRNSVGLNKTTLKRKHEGSDEESEIIKVKTAPKTLIKKKRNLGQEVLQTYVETNTENRKFMEKSNKELYSIFASVAKSIDKLANQRSEKEN